jgi:broad specificity phosphatase PhoE
VSERGARAWLARHGETAWSAFGRHTGRTDIPLSDRGRREAGLLGARLGAQRFVRVFTSPLRRAADTCRLAGFGDVAEPRDDLVEWDYGAYEGRTTPEIRAERPGWLLWTDGASGGESAAEVGVRADRMLAELRGIDGDVAVFAHGHVLRVLAARWLGLPPSEGRLLALGTTAIGVLGYERGLPVILNWNEDCHLPREAPVAQSAVRHGRGR